MPNKVTRAVKDFFIELTSDPDVQESFKAVIMQKDKSTAQAFLGAAAHVLGRPRETVQIDTTPSMARLLAMALQQRDQDRDRKS